MQVWNPRLIGHIGILEKVQRRDTKIPTELSELSYDQRLVELGLTSLKDESERRLKCSNSRRYLSCRMGKRVEHQRKNKRA